MRRRRLALVLVALAFLAPPAAAETVVQGTTTGTCADIVDGFGRVVRGTLGLQELDLGGRLSFTVDYAASTCRSLRYRLDVWRVHAPALLNGPEYDHVGTVDLRSTGATSLTFHLAYHDFAALRDPFDESGQDRCVYVVATVESGETVLDRAPDAGMHVLCHREADGTIDDQGGTQAPFQ